MARKEDEEPNAGREEGRNRKRKESRTVGMVYTIRAVQLICRICYSLVMSVRSIIIKFDLFYSFA